MCGIWQQEFRKWNLSNTSTRKIFLNVSNVIHCVFRIKTINQVIRGGMNESARVLRYILNCVLYTVSFSYTEKVLKHITLSNK